MEHMDFYMKQILVDLDDRCARDLERVAPAKKRMRAEFVRLAIRHAIDLALDRATAAAYRRWPLPSEVTPADLLGWDEHNALARSGRKPTSTRGHKRRAKSMG